ncbi:hypothetical protein LCGC14_2437490 [marine sediment metagenome]|uniref:Uncharacterized protein n=1 Tax=marine sediment metagenome TaxID=412755 RepID=A0A0F9C7G8_9ZZZZ
MTVPSLKSKEIKRDTETVTRFYETIPTTVQRLLVPSEDDTLSFEHVDITPIASQDSVIEIIQQARRLIFPGYFIQTRMDSINLGSFLCQEAMALFNRLSQQIVLSIQHECLRLDMPCSKCLESSHKTAFQFIQSLPDLKTILAGDIDAAFAGDPAAKSYDEIIFSYPGLFAITVYRVAHLLFELDIPLLPRIMTEHAHNLTGIDIHPGAQIGESFVIDHGTGVVIGETTIIGKHVRIYQGVTLGALSLPKQAGNKFRGKKRHPTIEDNVIIYSSATILGGSTTIGARSVIGGNVWITKSVPPDTKVMLEEPRLIFQKKPKGIQHEDF